MEGGPTSHHLGGEKMSSALRLNESGLAVVWWGLKMFFLLQARGAKSVSVGGLAVHFPPLEREKRGQ